MSQRRLAILIIVGVLCWGIYHARGAYLLNHNPARAAIVLGCVLLFLAAFVAVFLTSRRKLDRRAAEELRAEQEEESSGPIEP
jgi:drug/metabolite transporter (DMT)-like permease